MKVIVTLTIEVNEEAWTTAFGVEGKSDIRKDVKSYVINTVQNLPPFEEGGFVSVEGK